MKIKKKLALKIMKYLLENPSFHFPFEFIYSDLNENISFEKVELSEEMILYISNNEKIQNFFLKENFEKLDILTLQFLLKGFIDKIVAKDLLERISDLANEYYKSWNSNLIESVKIEEYGFNEFIKGKAEGFEESLEILNDYYYSHPHE